jgi:hypothetical protein
MRQPNYDDSNEVQRQRTERYADRGAATPDDPHLTEEPDGPNEMHPRDFAEKFPEKFAKLLDDLERSRSGDAIELAQKWRAKYQPVAPAAAAPSWPAKPGTPATPAGSAPPASSS